ncbi:MAG: HYC_CC_PP family protein [Paludibacter sp.]
MKKLFSILFAALILLSGMHLSMASHYCEGELTAVKWSLDDEKASCGMATDHQTIPNGYSAECCQDQLAFYEVDNNYNPASFQLNQPTDQLLQVFYIPETSGLLLHSTKLSSKTNVQPPGKFFACAVSLPDICVFRI